MKLLSINSDSKTIKGLEQGYLTGVTYLAPAKISGFEVCGNSSQACRDACLYTAGRGAFSNVQNARINRTKFFFNDRENFMFQLVKEISALKAKAKKLNLIPAIRLNGTSDINWIKVKANDGKGPKINIFEMFPFTQFYDYTKNFNMLAQSEKIKNYHLTFSYSGENKAECLNALKKGFNISVVFKGKFLPALFDKRVFKSTNDWRKPQYKTTIINGDLSDLRFLDKGPVIVGLLAKGKARKQDSSFII